MPYHRWTDIRNEKLARRYRTVADLSERDRRDVQEVTGRAQRALDGDPTILGLHVVLQAIRERAYAEGYEAAAGKP